MGAIDAFKELAATDHASIIITDAREPDNPIVLCNDPFLELTGYGRQEVIGRNCRFLQGPETDAESVRILHEAIRSESPVVVELLNYRKDGTPFLNSVMIAPIFDEDQTLVGFIGHQFRPPDAKDQFVQMREERARRLVKLLTKRQKQVLSGIARGLPAKQIAFELGLAERTIKLHRSNMIERLGAKTTTEAIRIAVRARL
ncbi:PAS domain-containing protein [Tsuneonella mangrovi]|uniref:PAS domain-containing protein n=1 Tax=Tsuneonella mangrovi TaxID=1982042 RepID=UPI001F0A8F2C|nr:PAS domain-containing protein [Tsuneonella mangrovi]